MHVQPYVMGYGRVYSQKGVHVHGHVDVETQSYNQGVVNILLPGYNQPERPPLSLHAMY